MWHHDGDTHNLHTAQFGCRRSALLRHFDEMLPPQAGDAMCCDLCDNSKTTAWRSARTFAPAANAASASSSSSTARRRHTQPTAAAAASASAPSYGAVRHGDPTVGVQARDAALDMARGGGRGGSSSTTSSSGKKKQPRAKPSQLSLQGMLMQKAAKKSVGAAGARLLQRAAAPARPQKRARR